MGDSRRRADRGRRATTTSTRPRTTRTTRRTCPARTARPTARPAASSSRPSAGVTYRIAVAGYAGARRRDRRPRIGAGALGTLPPNPGALLEPLARLRRPRRPRRDSASATSSAGSSGDDRLRGGRGDDCLYGDRGKDRLDGGSGRDRVFGNSGNDRVSGGTRQRPRGRQQRQRPRQPGAGATTWSPAASGNDVISVRDGRRDRVNCGRGPRPGAADRRDRLRGCERVRRRLGSPHPGRAAWRLVRCRRARQTSGGISFGAGAQVHRANGLLGGTEGLRPRRGRPAPARDRGCGREGRCQARAPAIRSGRWRPSGSRSSSRRRRPAPPRSRPRPGPRRRSSPATPPARPPRRAARRRPTPRRPAPTPRTRPPATSSGCRARRAA